MVEVKFLARFRDITGEKSLNLDYNGSLGSLIDFLIGKYGNEFKDALFDNNGELRDYMKVLVNGEDLQVIGGFDGEVKEGDEIVIFQTIAGG